MREPKVTGLFILLILSLASGVGFFGYVQSDPVFTPMAILVISGGVILLLVDVNKRQRRLIKLLLGDPSEQRAQLRIFELAKIAQEQFEENQSLQQLKPEEIDGQDCKLSGKRFWANHLARSAKADFWFVHDYLVNLFGYRFPFTKISQFAANDPRQAPWPTSAKVSKQEQPRGRDEAVPST